MQFLIQPSSITMSFEVIEISFNFGQSTIHPFSIRCTLFVIVKASITGLLYRMFLGNLLTWGPIVNISMF